MGEGGLVLAEKSIVFSFLIALLVTYVGILIFRDEKHTIPGVCMCLAVGVGVSLHVHVGFYFACQYTNIYPISENLCLVMKLFTVSFFLFSLLFCAAILIFLSSYKYGSRGTSLIRFSPSCTSTVINNEI